MSTFFVSMDLYNEKGERITEIALNSPEIIKPKKEYTFDNYYNVDNSNIQVRSAKVVSLIPNFSKNSTEFFDQMEEQIAE